MTILKRIAAALAALLAFAIAWGLVEPYVLHETEERAIIPNLPEEWEGRRFAQLSDWQLGMWGDNRPAVRRAVNRLIELRPAFVVLTGDFVYHPGDDAEEVIGEVAEIARTLPAADIPTYAVLGNHDWGMAGRDVDPDENLARRVASALEDAGVRVLENDAVRLPQGGATGVEASFYVSGIGARWPNRDDPARAVRDVPDAAARVVIMHNPQSFPGLPAGTAPIAVAGHTHGGQMRLPFTPGWSYLDLVRPEEVHADGWAEEEFGRHGNRLYVNRGIGMSGLPMRINCRPEITIFRLTRTSQAARPPSDQK